MVARNGWPVDVHPLPPLLHNQPHLIADEVRRLATSLATEYAGVAVGYADCGTYGALDQVCEELGLRAPARVCTATTCSPGSPPSRPSSMPNRGPTC